MYVLHDLALELPWLAREYGNLIAAILILTGTIFLARRMRMSRRSSIEGPDGRFYLGPPKKMSPPLRKPRRPYAQFGPSTERARANRSGVVGVSATFDFTP